MKLRSILSFGLLVPLSLLAMENNQGARFQSVYDGLKSAEKALVGPDSVSCQFPEQIDVKLYLGILQLQKQTLDKLLPEIEKEKKALAAKDYAELCDPSYVPRGSSDTVQKLSDAKFRLAHRSKSCENIVEMIKALEDAQKTTITTDFIKNVQSSGDQSRHFVVYQKN